MFNTLLRKFGIGMGEPPSINEALQRISKRAERMEPSQQGRTYVNLGGIEATLQSRDNRVIFGRRGTGKTHVMLYIADTARQMKDLPVYVDLRNIGSNSYIYSDGNRSASERATYLLRDFVNGIQNSVVDEFTRPNSTFRILNDSSVIDRLGGCAKEILVADDFTSNNKMSNSEKGDLSGALKGDASLIRAKISANIEAKLTREALAESDTTLTGKSRLSINIGDAFRAFQDLAAGSSGRIWILIDEWSVIPEDLQPYLADFIKRTMLNHPKLTVQIAAIEQRSHFRSIDCKPEIGIELGSDISADVNLDDHLVFENSPEESVRFFSELLLRHFNSVMDELGGKGFTDPREFIRHAFTQEPAFKELVRSSEGVPRDAINILQIAAVKARTQAISVPIVRSAAGDWYDRDKSTWLDSNKDASDLLGKIIREVIGTRKARAFLVPREARDPRLERMFDERLLHIAKKSYSSKDEPGKRYKVWKIDYGCYVSTINTASAPTGFLFAESEGYDNPAISSDNQRRGEVPEDDFRAIRRAVLNLEDLN